MAAHNSELNLASAEACGDDGDDFCNSKLYRPDGSPFIPLTPVEVVDVAVLALQENVRRLNLNSSGVQVFADLPADLKCEIFFWLEMKDLCITEQVCKEWQTLSSSNIVWKKLYERNFGPTEETAKLVTDEQKLFWAVKRNHYHMCKFLITRYPTLIESASDSGFSPLYRGAQKGHLRIVRLLVEHGADVDTKRGDGSTPLYIACQENRLQVVNYLLSRGANVEATFKTGFTSMYIASQKGHLAIVKTLLGHNANIDAAAEYGATPLYIAAQNGHCHVVKYLIESGANIESTFKDGFTPIYIAAQKGHTAIVEELIKYKANIEARGGDSTPIYVAAQNGHAEVVKTLIKYGADVEAKYKGFYTPLYIAAQKGHVEILRLLLTHGADMEQKCARGSTALYVSSQNGHLEVVKELITHWANPDVVFDNNVKKRKPIDIAIENNHSEIEEHLRKYMESITAGVPIDVALGGPVAAVQEQNQENAA